LNTKNVTLFCIVKPTTRAYLSAGENSVYKCNFQCDIHHSKVLLNIHTYIVNQQMLYRNIKISLHVLVTSATIISMLYKTTGSIKQ